MAAAEQPAFEPPEVSTASASDPLPVAGARAAQVDAVDDVRKLNIRIFTAVWGLFAAVLIVVSLAESWLVEYRGSGRFVNSVWDLDSYPFDSGALPWALICGRWARRVGCVASVGARRCVSGPLRGHRGGPSGSITRLWPAQHHVEPGLWMASIGLVVSLLVFAARAWLGWSARPKQADRHPDVESRPGLDPKK